MFKLVTCALLVWSVGGQRPIPRPFNPFSTVPPFPGASPYPFVPILNYENEINVDGSYRYNFATADGKQAEESGFLKNVSIDKDGEPVGVQVVQGSYSYTAPDGTPVQVSYIADENGFQPTSVRIPADGRYPDNIRRPLDPRARPLDPRVLPSALRNPYNPYLNNIGRFGSPFNYNRNYDYNYNKGYDNNYNKNYEGNYNKNYDKN